LCSILHTLRVRYALDMIYTYSGGILIAVGFVCQTGMTWCDNFGTDGEEKVPVNSLLIGMLIACLESCESRAKGSWARCLAVLCVFWCLYEGVLAVSNC